MTLIAFMVFCSFESYGQAALSINGESLFRTHSYGVTNHRFEQNTQSLISPFGNKDCSPNPMITGACGAEIFSGTIYTYGSSTQNVNTMRILPYSINDCSDYLNGVSTLDIVHIQRHINGIANLNTLIPTADDPYRRISADADNDRVITTADLNMIRDLILGVRCDLSRTSWEWVNANEVAVTATSFNTNPYNFVINYNWPGGIYFPSKSRNNIIANLSTYFTYRTTKIGDIVGNGPGGTTTNSWICGSGTYYNNTLDNRSKENNQKLEKGSILNYSINISNNEDLMSIEIPLTVDTRALELKVVSIMGANTAKWNFNKALGTLVISDLDLNSKALLFKDGVYAELTFSTRSEITLDKELVNFSNNRQVEIINAELDNANAGVEINLSSIYPPSMNMNWNQYSKILEVIISNEGQTLISVIDLNGQRVMYKELELTKGIHQLDLNSIDLKGMYIVNVTNGKETLTKKIIIL